MTPLIEVARRGGDVRQPERPMGVVANTPDVDGEYEMISGDLVTVEMNPPEAQEEKRRVIALTSEFFRGHKRSIGKRGPARILVYLNKHGRGSRDISSFERIMVKPHTTSLKLVK